MGALAGKCVGCGMEIVILWVEDGDVVDMRCNICLDYLCLIHVPVQEDESGV